MNSEEIGIVKKLYVGLSEQCSRSGNDNNNPVYIYIYNPAVCRCEDSMERFHRMYVSIEIECFHGNLMFPWKRGERVWEKGILIEKGVGKWKSLVERGLGLSWEELWTNSDRVRLCFKEQQIKLLELN